MATKVTVIGEALVDVVPGDEALVGGSPLNVAVGLARLGLPTEFHANVGDDEYGRQIVDALEGEDVRLPEGFVGDGRTSTATVTFDDQGSANYEFDLIWDIAEPDVAESVVVHTGSIGAILEPGGTVARDSLRGSGSGVLRSYDPNIRPNIMGDADRVRAVVRGLFPECHVVKLSDVDAEWIGADTGATAEEVLESVARAGARFAVMTRGEDGAIAIVDGVTYEVPAREVELVDTIGAGDAFMSGLLFALVRDGADRLLVDGEELSGELVESVLHTAVASAAVAVSRKGAQPPFESDLEVG